MCIPSACTQTSVGYLEHLQLTLHHWYVVVTTQKLSSQNDHSFGTVPNFIFFNILIMSFVCVRVDWAKFVEKMFLGVARNVPLL